MLWDESDESQASSSDSESTRASDSDVGVDHTAGRSSGRSYKDSRASDSDVDVDQTPRRSSGRSYRDPLRVLTTTLATLLQNAIESPREQDPRRPSRQRRGRKWKNDEVEVMKMAETSEVRNVFLVSVQPKNPSAGAYSDNC